MISVVMPTYRRERILVETIERVLALDPAPDELIVVDQTPAHEAETSRRLSEWEQQGRVRWLRREEPSIPAAMNAGLLAARGEIVLFLDDDVIPAPDLAVRHLEAHRREQAVAVAGQVLQPGESPCRENVFRFCSAEPAWIANAMAGNLSVRRVAALEAGGFDENFRGAAYRFESEFASRLCRGDARIYFEPRASIRHLRAGHGGTRASGDHLTSVRPDHSVGAYYFELVSGARPVGPIARRMLGSVATRHHFRRPWWIPITLVAETRGLVWALRLWLSGPKLLSARADHD